MQTFAWSCNGYAWYKNGIIPEQPGMKHDFLPEMVKLGHEWGMKVFGYFCAGGNNRWEEMYPDLCYQTRAQQIPFTTQYLDYLCASIEDARVTLPAGAVFRFNRIPREVILELYLYLINSSNGTPFGRPRKGFTMIPLF